MSLPFCIRHMDISHNTPCLPPSPPPIKNCRNKKVLNVLKTNLLSSSVPRKISGVQCGEYTSCFQGSTFSLPKVAMSKCDKNVQISFCKMLKNKQYQVELLFSSFHLNGHTIGFHVQTQKLEYSLFTRRHGCHIGVPNQYWCPRVELLYYATALFCRNFQAISELP